MRSRLLSEAYSLIELLVVLSIIGIILAISSPRFVRKKVHIPPSKIGDVLTTALRPSLLEMGKKRGQLLIVSDGSEKVSFVLTEGKRVIANRAATVSGWKVKSLRLRERFEDLEKSKDGEERKSVLIGGVGESAGMTVILERKEQQVAAILNPANFSFEVFELGGE